MVQVKKYVDEFMDRVGIAPSYRMIADELGMSKPKVADTVRRLVVRGDLEKREEFRNEAGKPSTEMRAIKRAG